MVKQVLRAIKSDLQLREIPVLIISATEKREDISDVLREGAVAYINKSIGFEKLNETLSAIHQHVMK